MAYCTSYPIGIDLGTTYSCVAVWRSERAEIIANDQGNRTTPSCVAFTSEEKLVGEAAKNQAAYNVQNTVFAIKRMMGRQFNDAQLQADTKHWPFKVCNRGGNPVVEVQHKRAVKQFTPEEISAMILAKMKQTAELKLGPVKDVVITVPAYFNNAQRQATKDAGTIAGFNVLRILAEPTAAALAYGLGTKVGGKKNILVYDLGGGTFDVSLLTIEGNDFNVLATTGDSHLGGEDFDTRLVTHFVQEIKRKHRRDISTSPKAVRRLRTVCERAKRILSSATRATVEVDALYDGLDFQSVLTRAKFDEICGDLFAKTIPLISKVLIDAKLTKHQIDEVVLSGGSSRIVKVQQLISEFFGGKTLNTSINLDEAVAMGAAIQAMMLKDSFEKMKHDIHLVDITPLSLGVKVDYDDMSFVIGRNSVLPTTQTSNFTTMVDYQEAVVFCIYEGESPSAKENLLLGEFTLHNIQIARRGEANFVVTFQIDCDGILRVTACDAVTGSSNAISIVYKGRLTKDQINAIIRNSGRLINAP